MKTNFFELVAGLGFTGTLQIIINQSETGTQTVSVLPSAKDTKSGIGKNLPPLLLKASPQELNDTFFKHLTEPIKQTEKVFINAEAYQKELEKAKKQTTDNDKKPTGKPGASAPNKAVANTNLFSQPAGEQPDDEQHDDDDDDEILDEQPDNSELLLEKQRLYAEAMQKVNTLNGQMKYAEAIAQLPDPEEYPDKVEEIKNKGEALLKRQEMFAALQTEV